MQYDFKCLKFWFMLISFKNALLIFLFTLIIFDPWPLLAILKTLLSFLNLVQYIFTCVFKFCFHACYFFIRDCNTFGGNMIPYYRYKSLCRCISQCFPALLSKYHMLLEMMSELKKSYSSEWIKCWCLVGLMKEYPLIKVIKHVSTLKNLVLQDFLLISSPHS